MLEASTVPVAVCGRTWRLPAVGSRRPERRNDPRRAGEKANRAYPIAAESGKTPPAMSGLAPAMAARLLALESVGTGPLLLPETWWERPFTWLATAVDAAVVVAMRAVVDRMMLPASGQIEALRRSAEPFLTGEHATSPERFLVFEGLPRDASGASMRIRRAIQAGTVLSCRLETAAAPGDPIRLERWMHPTGRSAGTILLLHGFAMGYPRIDAFVLLAQEWFRRGLDVALMTLPFHGRRTPATARFSGEHFAQPDVGELNAAAARAVYEILLATRWLRAETCGPLGILGLSLGGYLASTVAALDGELDFVIPMVPPVCMGDLAWRFQAATHAARSPGQTAMTHDELRTAFRVHSPLAYQVRVPRERLLIVAGRADRIVPPEHPHALWRHWGEPAIHWFGGSHLAPFGRSGIVGAITAHLTRLGVLG